MDEWTINERRYLAQGTTNCRRCGELVMSAIRVVDGRWRLLDPNGGEHWSGCAGRSDRIGVGRTWKSGGRAMVGKYRWGNTK